VGCLGRDLACGLAMTTYARPADEARVPSGKPRGILVELFDTPVKWRWKRQDSRTRVAVFQVGETDMSYPVTYEFHADRSNSGNWEVDFSDVSDDDTGDISITGAGNAGRVFATVLDILKNFITEEEPVKVRFSSDELSRSKLYRKMVERFARGLGYSARVTTYGRGAMFDLTRETAGV